MSRWLGTLGLRRGLVGLVCALVAGGTAPSALAHATLERSDPADGVSVARSPETVRLWFDEAIVARFSTATVVTADGDEIAPAALEVDGDRLTLRLDDELVDGVYSIDWEVLSAEDGHFRGGLVVFAVGPGFSPAAAGGVSADEISARDAMARWLNFAVLAALTGGLVAAGFVFSPSSGACGVQSARRRVLTWASACAAIGLLVGGCLLLQQASTVTGGLGRGEPALSVAGDLLVGTRFGALWIAHEAILLVLLALLLILRRRIVPAGLVAAGVLVVCLAAVQALAGHAAAVTPRTGLAVTTSTVHILAAGLWIGGLAAALVGLWPLARGRAEARELTRTSLARFGGVAALGVGLLAVTGLYYAGRQVASPDALLTTLYGRTLLVKSGLFLLAGLVGLLNAMLFRPRLAAPLAWLLDRPPGWTPVSPTRLRPLVLAELAVGIAVLGAAGILAAAVPARGPEFAPAAEPGAVPRGSLSVRRDDLLVTLTAKPNRVGNNVFQVIVGSAMRPPPGEIRGVELRFSRSGGTVVAPMSEVEPGRFRASGSHLDRPGRWQVAVAVDRTGAADAVAPFEWRTAPAAGRAVVVSDRPLGPFLTASAAVLLVGVLIASALLLRGPSRPRDGPKEPEAALRSV